MTTNEEQLGQILTLAPLVGVSDWWLTAGALFQTVWNETKTCSTSTRTPRTRRKTR